MHTRTAPLAIQTPTLPPYFNVCQVHTISDGLKIFSTDSNTFVHSRQGYESFPRAKCVAVTANISNTTDSPYAHFHMTGTTTVTKHEAGQVAMAFGDGVPSVRRFGSLDGRLTAFESIEVANAFRVIYSNDGKRIFIGTTSGDIFIYDSQASPKLLAVIRAYELPFDAIACASSSTAKLVAFGGYSKCIVIIDFDGATPPQYIETNVGEFVSLVSFVPHYEGRIEEQLLLVAGPKGVQLFSATKSREFSEVACAPNVKVLGINSVTGYGIREAIVHVAP